MYKGLGRIAYLLFLVFIPLIYADYWSAIGAVHQSVCHKRYHVNTNAHRITPLNRFHVE